MKTSASALLSSGQVWGTASPSATLQVLLWQESQRIPEPASESSQPAPEGSQPESTDSQPASECCQVMYSLDLRVQQVANMDLACQIELAVSCAGTGRACGVSTLAIHTAARSAAHR